MPITLGCPSCGKRFRARDESAGKRVKCPFCQAAVSVPSSDEARHAAAGTDEAAPLAGSVAGSPPVTPHRPPAPPRDAGPAPVAPGGWGTPESAGPRVFKEEPLNMLPPVPVPAPAGGRRPAPPVTSAAPVKTPEERAAAGWKKARAGLCWVTFGLFWFALLGCVPLAKVLYERQGNELPDGEGWVKIEGYVNSSGTEGFHLTKRDEINLLAYGVPAVLGALCLTLGRVTCGAAPRASGAKGMFALSGLFTLVALAGGITVVVSYTMGLDDTLSYAIPGSVVVLLLAEVWFLMGLGTAGAYLQWPWAARAAGFVVLVAGIVGGLAVAAIGREWEVLTVTKRSFSTPPAGAKGAAPNAPPNVQPAPAPVPKGGGKKGGGKKDDNKAVIAFLDDEPKKEEPKKDEAKKDDPEKPEPKKDDPEKPEPKKTEPTKKAESTKKTEPKKKPETKKTEPKKDDKTDAKAEPEAGKDAAAKPARAAVIRPDDYTVQVRHKVVDEEFRLYEMGGGTGAWLILMLAYWRAVRSTRRAIREHLTRLSNPVA